MHRCACCAAHWHRRLCLRPPRLPFARRRPATQAPCTHRQGVLPQDQQADRSHEAGPRGDVHVDQCARSGRLRVGAGVHVRQGAAKYPSAVWRTARLGPAGGNLPRNRLSEFCLNVHHRFAQFQHAFSMHVVHTTPRTCTTQPAARPRHTTAGCARHAHRAHRALAAGQQGGRPRARQLESCRGAARGRQDR